MIKDGNIIILRNGRTYLALGERLYDSNKLFGATVLCPSLDQWDFKTFNHTSDVRDKDITKVLSIKRGVEIKNMALFLDYDVSAIEELCDTIWERELKILWELVPAWTEFKVKETEGGELKNAYFLGLSEDGTKAKATFHSRYTYAGASDEKEYSFFEIDLKMASKEWFA